jgi:gliding motility-associated-like protein
VALNDGTCESARTPITATIQTVPAKPILIASAPTALCPGQSVTLTAPAGFTYSWSTGATAQQIIVSTAGSYSVVVNNGVCSSISSDPVVVTIISCNQPPVISTSTNTTPIEGDVSIYLGQLITDPDNNLDFSTLRIIAQPRSGARANIQGQILFVDYEGLSFAGTDELTIEICDIQGACVQQKIVIEVIGDIIPFNGLSNNGDALNAKFLIQYIEAIPETRENKVMIYNRWGDLVWEGVNYDNSNIVFEGKNRQGVDLPTGTYFYKIEFQTRSTVTGYLSLKR